MPTSGKSTISNEITRLTNYSHIDLDHMLENRFGTTLQEFINSYGENEFVDQENSLMLEIKYPEDCIISTGGSVIYATSAMERLKADGVHFVYLKTSISKLEKRLHNQRDMRGIIMRGCKNWSELLANRSVLYSKYADTVIETDGLSLSDISQKIIDLM